MVWRKPGAMGIASQRLHRLPIFPGFGGDAVLNKPDRHQLPEMLAEPS
jgi:hypothetical protein